MWTELAEGVNTISFATPINKEICIGVIDYTNNTNTPLENSRQVIRIEQTAPTCTNSGSNTSWTNGNRTLTGTCADTGGSGCSSATVTVRTINGAGTASSTTSKIVKIDRITPTCTSSGGNTAWTNGNRTLTGTCSDTGGSGCSGNATSTISVNTNTTTASPGSVSDNAGNTASCPADQTVKIDKTAPTGGVSVSGGSTSSWSNSTATVTFAPVDSGGSGVKSWTIAWYNGSWGSAIAKTGTTFSEAFTSSGRRRARITVTDNAGNSATHTTSEYLVDITNPSLTPSCYHYSTTGQFRVSYTDAHSGMAAAGASVGGTAFTQGTSYAYRTYSPAGNPSTVSVTYRYVKDNAGNSASSSTSYTCTITYAS